MIQNKWISGAILFGVFFLGIGAQWRFEVFPGNLSEKRINWIDRPAVRTTYRGRICYIWRIKHEYHTRHELKVCRREEWL